MLVDIVFCWGVWPWECVRLGGALSGGGIAGVRFGEVVIPSPWSALAPEIRPSLGFSVSTMARRVFRIDVMTHKDDLSFDSRKFRVGEWACWHSRWMRYRESDGDNMYIYVTCIYRERERERERESRAVVNGPSAFRLDCSWSAESSIDRGALHEGQKGSVFDADFYIKNRVELFVLMVCSWHVLFETLGGSLTTARANSRSGPRVSPHKSSCIRTECPFAFPLRDPVSDKSSEVYRPVW